MLKIFYPQKNKKNIIRLDGMLGELIIILLIHYAGEYLNLVKKM